jgi:hypothetical protein
LAAGIGARAGAERCARAESPLRTNVAQYQVLQWNAAVSVRRISKVYIEWDGRERGVRWNWGCTSSMLEIGARLETGALPGCLWNLQA